MTVFRIEKTQNHTMMSNHHLRSKALTLKARGLLSQMLSLPDEWDFTLAGLAAARPRCKGKDGAYRVSHLRAAETCAGASLPGIGFSNIG